MRVAVLTEPGSIVVEERERPEPAADEVLVRVREVGICGSDVHYWEHGRIGDYVVESPLVLGHESAGEVVATDGAVEGLATGDRVALEPGVPCRTCAHCKRGAYNRCDEVTFMATPPDDGAFAEYVAWPADLAHQLPDAVSLRAGALCEPLSVGIHACRRGEVTTGDTVAITGGGPIGLLAMAAANAAGATDVTVADPVDEKRERAAARGADRVVDPSATSLATAIRSATGDGADVVVEASGAASAITETVDVARRGGTVVLVGLANEPSVPIDVLELVDSELDVRGSFRYANTYPTAIDLLADGAVDVESIVDFEAPLAEVAAAFERAAAPETVKGMIQL